MTEHEAPKAPHSEGLAPMDDLVRGEDDSVHREDDPVHGDDDSVHGDDDPVHGDDDSVHGDDDSVHGDDDLGDEEPLHVERGEPGYRGRAWAQASLVTLVAGAALAYAFDWDRAGPAQMLPPIGAAYLALGLGAVAYAARQGDLRTTVAPRRLDVTIGAVVAGVLYLVANLVPVAVLQGRPGEAWLWRLTLQLGDPREAAPPYIGVAVLAIAALEELAWRGWVMRVLRRAHGPRTALLATTGLYALAHGATPWLLRDPEAGMNPLLMVAAAGCGLAWGAMAWRFERLGPSLFAHALFSWAMALFPMWRRI